MSEKKVKDYEWQCLIELLSALMNGKAFPQFARLPDWGKLYQLAEDHWVANTTYYRLIGVEHLGLGPWRERFEERYHEAVVNEQTYSEVLPKLLVEFEKYHVHCMVLHESVMRTCYPKPEMRYTREVRILIGYEGWGAVDLIMKNADFEEVAGMYAWEKRYHKAPGITISFQDHMPFSGKKINRYFAYPVSDYESLYPFEYIHSFEQEEQYIYLIACTAESYARGTIKIQRVLDLWLFWRSHEMILDWEVISKELEYLHLNQFEEMMLKLATNWFEGQSYPQDQSMISSMEQYMQSGGDRCRKENETLLPLIREVYQAQKREARHVHKSKKKRNWIFPDLEYMSTMFPSLPQHKWRLPFCWMLRIIRICRYQLFHRS
jgi:hypothetical protein